jgi:hypothetical protein
VDKKKLAFGDAVAALAVEPKRKCAIKKIVDNLVKEDITALNNLLNSSVGPKKIVTLLRSYNHAISEYSINNHRSQLCGCENLQ